MGRDEMAVPVDAATLGFTPAPISEIDYHLLVAEFDMLWSRRPDVGLRERMDQMMRLISAFEESRRIASSA